MHVAAVCFCHVKRENWFVLSLTRGRNCLPTSMRMQKRETYRTRTVLMKWRTTASWWTEMYVTCLVFSSISPPLSLPFSRGRLCVLVSSRWIVNCTSCSWWFMLKLISGDGVCSSPVLPLWFISYTTVSVGCFCLFLSVSICSHFLLFSLPVCPLFFSSTLPCFFQSGRYCIKSSFSPSHVPYFLIPPVKVESPKSFTILHLTDSPSIALCKDFLSGAKYVSCRPQN